MSNRTMITGAAVASLILGVAIIGFAFIRNTREQESVRDQQRQYSSALQESLAFRQNHEKILQEFSKEKESWKTDRDLLTKKIDEVTRTLTKVVHERDYMKQTMVGFHQELESLAQRMKNTLEKPDTTPSIMKTGAESKIEPGPLPKTLTPGSEGVDDKKTKSSDQDPGLETPMGK